MDTHKRWSVFVRLNEDMMRELDAVRGLQPRGTYMRELFDRDPAVINYRKWLRVVAEADLLPPPGRT
jgi:hypothetical protein